MMDRLTVMGCLEGLTQDDWEVWYSDSEVQETAKAAISLLKEREAKSPVIREKNGYWDYVCPTCGSHDEELFREWNFCPFCGQEVKWE